MKLLPKEGLFDTMQVKLGHGERLSRRRFYRYFCKHERSRAYVRIDRRAGPGSFADNFKGVCCIDCGVIIAEKQTL